MGDLLRSSYGGGSLQMALVIVLIFNVISTASYLFAGRTLKADLARAHELSLAGLPMDRAEETHRGGAEKESGMCRLLLPSLVASLGQR